MLAGHLPSLHMNPALTVRLSMFSLAMVEGPALVFNCCILLWLHAAWRLQQS